MSKTRWVSKQFSRYDLTATKLQKLLYLITASSMSATAIALGATSILAIFLIIGFVTIMVVAYILDRIGFQRATAEELWTQQLSNLWWNQINVITLLYNIYGELTLEQQVEKLKFFLTELGIEQKLGEAISESTSKMVL